MKIGICNIDKEFRGKLKQLCIHVLESRLDEVEVILFSKGVEVLECEQELDILILDAVLDDINGITIKNQFQYRGIRTCFIFVTSHIECMKSAFGRNVLGFIEKEEMEKQLPLILKTAVQLFLNNPITIGNNINSKNVMFIKHQYNYSVLFLKDGTIYSLRESIKSLEQELRNADFVQVYRGVLVNMEFIDKIEGKQIYIKGKQVEMSERLKCKVRKKYETYCQKMDACEARI